jgi:serine/threonine-protein kinase SRK2
VDESFWLFIPAGTFGSVLHARNRQTGNYLSLQHPYQLGFSLIFAPTTHFFSLQRHLTHPIPAHSTYHSNYFPPTGEDVAIKLIALGEKFYQKYVDREIINHRLLVHPHVVAFKEVFVTSNYLCIVMEYVGGGNLQQWVEKHGRLPEWQARCFFQQVTLALHYIHKQLGIAHRDIKLGNILLNDRYQVPILKLCDFGYSKNMLGSVPKTRVGTAAYISPEVARTSGQAAYDTEKADVWSSAVTLYCMLAGCYPFSDARHEVHLKRIKELTTADVDTALARLSGGVASPECIHLLKGMLYLDPKHRLSLDQIMMDEWFKQFLPDLSRMAAAAAREVQSEELVLQVLAQAESLSEARRAGTDEFAEEVMIEVDDVIAAEEHEEMMMAAHHGGLNGNGVNCSNGNGMFHEEMTLQNMNTPPPSY